MKLGEGMRRGIIRRKHRKRKKQLRKLEIRLPLYRLRFRLNKVVEGVGLGDHHLIMLVVLVGTEVLRHMVKDRWLLRLNSGNNNNSNNNDLSLRLNNINNHHLNNIEVHLSNINLLHNNHSITNNNNNSNNHHHPDHLNYNNKILINKYQVVILKVNNSRNNNNKIVCLNRVINPLLSRINNNNNNSSSSSRDGLTNLNLLPCRSRRKQSHLLIRVGIDRLKLPHRLNNQRTTNLGLCKSKSRE
jgi:hypothetical protein